ncbi:hypothetical protein ZWY2020_037243 [Hordeum vulgare]|nr:hypothetical protein ZWY2020_037243 [Hordeum vulgare]
MEHSSHFFQKPVWLLRRASGRPLGDYLHEDGLGVLSTVATTPISAAASRAHGRAFCLGDYTPGLVRPAQPEPSSLLADGRSKIKNALKALKLHDRTSAAYRMAEELMLEGLEILEKLAKEEHLCSKRHSAIILFVWAMSPHHHGVDVGTCSNIVLEVSMRVAVQLLEAAPGEISTELNQQKKVCSIGFGHLAVAMGSVEILVEELMEAEANFEKDFDSTKMHRFPAGLRGMGDEYITPMVVAIGPYHHGALRLHKMEEVKCAAANHYITLIVHDKLPETEKIFKEARRRFCDDERSTLPWQVVAAVMDSLEPEARSTLMESVGNFIIRMGKTFKIRHDAEVEDYVWETDGPHLLGLFRRHKTEPGSPIKWPELNHISASSAIELAQMGIKLKASKTAAFTDMDVKRKWTLSGELSLAPLSLNDARARCLVNMAAFELTTALSYEDHPNSTAVCSYLALFTMLMASEDDVQELRSKRILHGHHTNTEMLAFFNGVMNHLPDRGCRFAHIMAHLVDYKKKSFSSLSTMPKPGTVANISQPYYYHHNQMRWWQGVMKS